MCQCCFVGFMSFWPWHLRYSLTMIFLFFWQRIGMRAQEQLGESFQPPAKKEKRKRIRYNIFEYDIFETSMC